MNFEQELGTKVLNKSCKQKFLTKAVNKSCTKAAGVKCWAKFVNNICEQAGAELCQAQVKLVVIVEA